ncbi:class I SAM-dependent methyltransferase [Spirosoma sp.]|uniref:class I SAM-dependent methyltransferase n=1 Tax=Spirosoma sp. TaxID=1899569 RepID=UPI003B3BB136
MNDHGIGKLYEDIADWFDQNRSKQLIEKSYLDVLVTRIKPAPSVLDLGCGSGEPIARYLIEQGCQITGVDGAASMIAMCQKRFPNMEWIRADMRGLRLERRFDAVIAWDSFFHLDQDAQRSLFPVFANHTRNGSVLLFTSGSDHSVAYGEMNGHTVYHASLDTAEYQSLLEENGFDVLIHAINDVNCGGRTVWLAKRRRE